MLGCWQFNDDIWSLTEVLMVLRNLTSYCNLEHVISWDFQSPSLASLLGMATMGGYGMPGVVPMGGMGGPNNPNLMPIGGMGGGHMGGQQGGGMGGGGPGGPMGGNMGGGMDRGGGGGYGNQQPPGMGTGGQMSGMGGGGRKGDGILNLRVLATREEVLTLIDTKQVWLSYNYIFRCITSLALMKHCYNNWDNRLARTDLVRCKKVPWNISFPDWRWNILLRPRRPRESDHLLRQRGHHLQGLLSRLQVVVYLTYQSAYKLVISESYGSLSEACRSPTTLDLWFFGWPCPPSSVAPSSASRLKIMKTAWSLIRVKPWSLK